MIERAYDRLRNGYFEEAVEGFSECLLLEPEDTGIYRGRAMAYFQIKKWLLAAADFRKVKELDPEDAEGWIGLAMCLAMEDKIYEAIEVFEELLVRQPRCVRAHIQLAQLHYRLGVITKGHQQLDMALAARPSLSARRMIDELKGQQLTLDKKRYYRPDFEALRRKNQAAGPGFLRRLRDRFRLP